MTATLPANVPDFGAPQEPLVPFPDKWEQPLAEEMRAAGLDPDTACSGCGFLLADHRGPLTQGQTSYANCWYGSKWCGAGPGVPGSKLALLLAYGTRNPRRLKYALREDLQAARLLLRSRPEVTT